MRVSVDHDVCAATGQCAMTCPDVFEMGNDGRLHVLRPSPPPELHDEVVAAFEGCPTGAITLDE
jgi:ferredoxin